jgi:hypothetical protein
VSTVRFTGLPAMSVPVRVIVCTRLLAPGAPLPTPASVPLTWPSPLASVNTRPLMARSLATSPKLLLMARALGGSTMPVTRLVPAPIT